jgi:hypothetical protein
MLYGVVPVLKMFGEVALLFSRKCPTFPGMIELVSLLFNRLNDDLMVVVFRSIWLRRNKMVFEEQFSSPLTVFNDASRHYKDFRLAHLKEKMVRQLNTNTFNSSKLWTSPNLECGKVNCDASLNSRNGVIGLGCVIRNDEGFFGC